MSLGTKHNSWAGSAGGLALRFLVLALSAGWAQAVPLTLLPLHAGSHSAGAGLDATFLRIDNAWKGSTVLWNEATKTYGNGADISSFGWGTGLWGRDDFDTIQAAGASFLAPQVGQPVVAAWAGQAASINFGNTRYNECYGSSQWGPVSLAPLFNNTPGTGAACSDDDGSVPEQTNWTARFAGFLRITESKDYWFSVLNDDGYFFRLIGANGDEVSAERDFLNPRERKGPDSAVSLTEGLYGVELGAWNRLGAGVVDFRWRTSATADWDLVPTANLLSSQSVPEPGLPALLGGAAAAWWLTRRRVPIAMHVGSA